MNTNTTMQTNRETELFRAVMMDALESYVAAIARATADEAVRRALDGYEEEMTDDEPLAPSRARSKKGKTLRVHLKHAEAKIGAHVIARSGTQYLPVVITGFMDHADRGRLFIVDRLDKHKIKKGKKFRLQAKSLKELYLFNEAHIHYSLQTVEKADGNVHRLPSIRR